MEPSPNKHNGKGPLHLSYNPKCPVCRFSAAYARFLAGWVGVGITTYAWQEGTPAPSWVHHFFESDSEGRVAFLPYFADTRRGDAWAGEEAVVEVHRSVFGKRGVFFGRWVALPTVKALMWLKKVVTG